MSLLRSTLFTLVGNLLTGLGSLLVAIFISRVLGPEGKGLLTFYVILASLVAMVAEMGISISNVYFHRSKGTASDVLFANGLLWSLAAGLVAIGVTAFGVEFFGSGHGVSRMFSVFAYACIPVYIFIGLQGHLLLALDKVAAYNYGNTAQPLAALVLTVAVFALGATPEAAMGAHMASLLVVSALLTRSAPPRSLKPDLGLLRDSLRFGFVGHLGTVAQFCNYRLDVIFLGIFADQSAVGIYSVAFTLGEILWRLPRAIGMILYPRISGATPAEANAITVRAFKLSTMALLVGSIPFAVVGALAIPWLFGNAFAGAVSPFLAILPGIFFFSWNTILVEDLKGRGHPNVKFRIAGLVLILTIALDLLLIPQYTLLGAALASSLAYTVAGVLAVRIFSRITGIPQRELLIPTGEDISFITNFMKTTIHSFRR